ncbi:hypothetical protein FB45DRAFT_1042652 [Roridomyces roridus]|uniref:Uncharacterized protein n=1 Tax=Roridomyces roridus TaxID=1738132 RepID=A0AAD7AZM9_9AGAR|nr:hypothetical protein FB45DRAFT_1042652 [Roridomyces roridus]
MYFAKLFLIIAPLALQTHAQILTADNPNLPLIQTPARASRVPQLSTLATPTVPAFVPAQSDIVKNTTVPLGQISFLGWRFPVIAGFDDDTEVFDGTSKNITIFFTPPGGVEARVVRRVPTSSAALRSPPGANSFLEIPSLLESWAPWLERRWVVNFGSSADTTAPLDPTTGCGPQPFDIQTAEFVATWEVVPA